MPGVGLNKAELETPFLWTDLDALERNIAHLAAVFQAARVGWRPHVKGIKYACAPPILLRDDVGMLSESVAWRKPHGVLVAGAIGDQPVVVVGEVARDR